MQITHADFDTAGDFQLVVLNAAAPLRMVAPDKSQLAVGIPIAVQDPPAKKPHFARKTGSIMGGGFLLKKCQDILPHGAGDFLVGVQREHPWLRALLQRSLLLIPVAQPILMQPPGTVPGGDLRGVIGGATIHNHDFHCEPGHAGETAVQIGCLVPGDYGYRERKWSHEQRAETGARLLACTLLLRYTCDSYPCQRKMTPRRLTPCAVLRKFPLSSPLLPMAIRLDKSIIRGEITNETQGRVTGRIWLLGKPDPIELNLTGNCLRDLAGCRLHFENPAPRQDPAISIVAAQQTGVVGDMTASRKSRIPTVSDDELMELVENKQPVPTRVANCLYLEWFSDLNGRMVIESIDFKLEITTPQWTMSAAEDALQSRESQGNFHAYLDSITGGPDAEEDDDDEEEYAEEDDDDSEDEFSSGEADGEESQAGIPIMRSETSDDGSLIEVNIEAEDEEPLNEFEWEQELREADRRAEAYQEAFDRYKDHPHRERLIAEAMGWEPEEVEEFRDDWQDVTESMQPQDPDEMLENAGMFTEDDEGSHHPLSRRAMDFALRLQRDAKSRGLFEGDVARDNPVLSVIVSIIALGGKLAAALDGTMHGFDPEPGFVIAMLKRSQIPLNEALHALSSIQMTGLSKDTRTWLIAARSELFELRKDILDLMSDLRK